MSSNLQQIQLNYDQMQDRLVLTLCTENYCEYRFWITRNMVQGVWQILQGLRKEQSKDDPNRLEKEKKASSSIHKERQNPLATKYTTPISQHPLGAEPLLLYKVGAKLIENGKVFFHFEDPQAKSIEFVGSEMLIDVLSQLIYKISPQTNWGLSF